jgi:hypothetical protein
MRLTFWTALLFGMFGLEGSVRADSTPPVSPAKSSAEDENRIRLKLMIPFWLPLLAMESSATLDGSQINSLEVESEVSWVVLGLLELGYRPLIARVDVFGAGFGEKVVHENGDPSGVMFDSSGLVARAVLMYELGPWRLGRSRKNRFVLEPLIGARYNRFGLEKEAPNQFSVHYDWLDPLVGARTEFVVGDFRFGTHIDVGGFTAASDIAFWAATTIEYRIVKWFSIWGGWQHYQVLFQQNTERGTERLRLYLTGPSAGFGLNIL